MGGTSYNKSALIDHNGDIKLYDRGNYINYWGFCVSYPIQYSVSQVDKLYSSNAWYIAIMSGFVCIYALDVTTENGSWSKSNCPYTLPKEYCPSISTTAPVVTGNGGSWTGYISVGTSGNIILGNYGNSGSGDKRRGFLMYPISMQYSVSPTNGQFKYVKDNNVGYICYSKINNILFITIVNCYVKSGYTTLCTLPQGCRLTAQIVFAIADNVAANYSYQRYCIINNNGEVIIKANANGEYIWATAATILNIPAQHSVSQDTKYAHLSWKAPYSNSTIQFDRIGNVVICHGNVKFTASAQCNYSEATETLPKGFRPTEVNVPIVFSINGRFAIFFEPSGKVTMLGNPNSDYACCTGSWYTKDDFPE